MGMLLARSLTRRGVATSAALDDLVRGAYQILEPQLDVPSKAGDWFTVDQERIDAFGAAIRDEQWIHCDPERARRESPFGGTIAHGNLILCMAPYLPRPEIEGDIPGLPPLPGLERGLNYGWNKVRFPAPVRSGARIRVSRTLRELKQIPPDALHIVTQLTVEVEGSDKPCCVAETAGRAIFAVTSSAADAA